MAIELLPWQGPKRQLFQVWHWRVLLYLCHSFC